MLINSDLRPFHRRAAEATIAAVSRVDGKDLDRPTPCAEWTLADLLAHMTVQNHGFAIAAEGGGADPAIWQVKPLGPDPVADYTAATEHVLAAFSADGVLDRELILAEFDPETKFPVAMAVGFHFIDCVVHGWDVARSLGIDYQLDEDLLAAALPIAEAVPNGERRLEPGASFRPALDAPENDPLGRILALLGRSPAWPA
jgi:uncharacterized protein (TIGR03086 family)